MNYFFCRPSWIPESSPETDVNPSVQDWVVEQAKLCRMAFQRLRRERSTRLKRAHKGRVSASYLIGEFVLVHKKRFPQWSLSKLGTQWFGPYRIVQLHHNAATVRASPRLGGEVEVGFSFLKKFHGNVESSSESSEEGEAFDPPCLDHPQEDQEGGERQDAASTGDGHAGGGEVLCRPTRSRAGAALISRNGRAM